jgi:pimeloyl-ACP methyl ester carboxylesterase
MRYFVARRETRQLGPAARSGQRGGFAALSDGLTHYELSGPDGGALVVFVPGMTIPLDFWDAIVGTLHERGFRTLTYTAYGRGYSDRVRTTYDRALFVRQLDDLLRAVGGAEIHLVASSMGALVSLEYARKPGATVASLTLSGPGGLKRERNPASRLPSRGPIAPFVGKYLLRRNLLRHITHNVRTDEDVARLRSLVLEGFQFEGSMYALLSTVMNFPLSEQEALFDATTANLPPTMLLWGVEDQVTPASDYQRAVELLRPVKAELIADCGHMASFERPREFAALLTAFVAEQATPQASRGALR